MIEPRYIAPLELRNWWSWIRPGLDIIKSKSTEAWIPEDVYADCFEKRSMLWVFTKQNRPVGFVVLQPVLERLHIWCAYGAEEDIAPECFEHILNIARQGNAKQLSFDSNRRGWERHAKKMGFRPRTWIKDL
jgi:hypothetical protein